MARSTEIDAQLMDFLYGELSDADAELFRERLAKDPELSAELEAFQRTREAFKALPVEDPPAAVSAQVLHEAAKRAPARKRAHTVEERPGFWVAVVEFFQPLMRHPAAASVAALLLIGGVAGALYLRGVDSPSHPTARSEAPAPGIADGKDVAAAEGTIATLDGLDLETEPSAGYADMNGEDNKELRAKLAEPEQEEALREQAEPQMWSIDKKSDRGGRARNLKRPPREPLANAVSGADPLIVPEDQGIRDTREESKKGKLELSEGDTSVARQAPLRKSTESAATAKPSERRRFDDDADDFAAADEEAFAPQAADPAPPPAAGATRSVTSSSGGGGYRGGQRVYRTPKLDQWAREKQGTLNKVLDKKITKMSTDKRCREAAKIANDILDRNPEYYFDKVKGSRWLKPCSGFVVAESKRRARKRSGGVPGKANAAKKRSKKAGSEPSKAKAAPAEDMAAESE